MFNYCPLVGLFLKKMRLSSFKIRNFKSIVDTGECHLSENDNVLVLAGQNEAGKSAVIEALSFFRDGPSENFDKLHRRKEDHPEVVCWFLLEERDIENIFNESKNQKLKDHLSKNKKISFKRGSVSEDYFEKIVFTNNFRDSLKDIFTVGDTLQKSPVQMSTTIETNSNEPVETTTIVIPLDFSIDNLEQLLVS